MTREWKDNVLLSDGVEIGRVWEYDGEWMGRIGGKYLHTWHGSAAAAKRALERGAFEGHEDTE
jgi:hypothetical protein